MPLSVRIKEVKPLANMKLSILFVNGIRKIYDVKQLMPQFPIFKDLENDYLFNMVKVDCGGCGVSWNSDIDISECELWENGQNTKDGDEFTKDEIKEILTASKRVAGGEFVEWKPGMFTK